MNHDDYRPDQPGFIFSANNNHGNIIFFITLQTPVFIASPNFSPLEIASSILSNVTKGHSEDFYTNILGHPITEAQKTTLEEELEKLIPNTGRFFISSNELFTFISSAFTGDVIVPTLVSID